MIDNLSMSADANIKALAPTTNYGSDTTVAVGEMSSSTGAVHRGFFKPDFSPLPPENVISVATLKLTIDFDLATNACTMQVFRCLQNWAENQITWNVFSTGNSWNSAGCSTAGTDYDATELGHIDLTASETGQKSISLNAAEIQKMFDGTYPNYGFVVRMNTELNDGYGFGSKEHATEASRPILTVTHEGPEISGNFFVFFG